MRGVSISSSSISSGTSHMLETFWTLGTNPPLIQSLSVVAGTPSFSAALFADIKLLIISNHKSVDIDELMCIMAHKFVIADELYYPAVWGIAVLLDRQTVMCTFYHKIYTFGGRNVRFEYTGSGNSRSH